MHNIAAIISARFRPDAAELATLRKQQEFIAKTGYETMTPMELTDMNARFHEAIASWSGNRFILQTVKRLNQLRRLIEYKRTSKTHGGRKYGPICSRRPR